MVVHDSLLLPHGPDASPLLGFLDDSNVGAERKKCNGDECEEAVKNRERGVTLNLGLVPADFTRGIIELLAVGARFVQLSRVDILVDGRLEATVLRARNLDDFSGGWRHFPLEHGLLVIVQQAGSDLNRALLSVEGHGHVVERLGQSVLVDVRRVSPQLRVQHCVLQVVVEHVQPLLHVHLSVLFPELPLLRPKIRPLRFEVLLLINQLLHL